MIVPAELTSADPLKLEPVGTGPFEFVEFIADSHVKLKRYEDYVPNEQFEDRTGFGGYKVACLDTVTFRIVTEPGARVAGLETGELHAVEDVPQASVERLEEDPSINIVPYENFWVHIATPNFAKPPTDDPLVRKAIQTALDMDEIMEAATDGAYNINYGFQTQNRAVYSDSGKEFFNLKDTEKAKALLEEAGYNGEELVLLTNKDYTTMYNAALVMQAQLQSIGMNVRLEVQDWPATIATRDNQHDAWNYHFTGWGTNIVARLSRGLQVPREAQADLQLRQPRGHGRRVRRGLSRHAEPADRRGARRGLRPGPAGRDGARHGAAVRLAHQEPGDAGERAQLRAVPHPAHVQRLDGGLLTQPTGHRASRARCPMTAGAMPPGRR